MGYVIYISNIFFVAVVMFTDIDIVKSLNNIANETLINIDRKKYYPFLSMVETYISDKRKNIIASRGTANYLLLNKSIDSDFIAYEVYCDDAVKHAREIATIIYNSASDKEDDIDLRLTQVVTNVPNKEISVKIGDREIVNLRNLQIHSGVYIIDVVLTVEKKGLFNKDLVINCISPEHQLIKLYSNLTDPKECGEWSKLLETEKILRGQLDLVNVGKDDSKSTTGGKKYSHRISSDDIVKKLYEDYASRPGHVIVGSFATGDIIDKQSRLQIISMYKLEDEEQEIKHLFNTTHEFGRMPIHIETSINYPHVPTEMKIRRLTVYYVFEKIRKVVADVFDTASYSLISFNKNDGFRIGTLFVLAKHLLIDLWTIRYIRKKNQITDEYYNNLTQKIKSDFKKLFYNLDLQTDLQWNEIFPLNPNNYLGHYEDEELAIKRMKRKEYESATKKYFAYYPYQVK
jgi:hypothetical protein